METLEQVTRESRRRLHPSLANSSFLVLDRRRKNFERWLRQLEERPLWVLDVGGRIQPYRALLAQRIQKYVALDLVNSPLVNVRATAEQLPFGNDTFDLVFGTQVFEYMAEPARAIGEIYRVLRSKGIALFSFPGYYPRIGENEHWRFLPAGVRHLLRPFGRVEIVPEGSTISGFFRGSAVCFGTFARYSMLRKLVSYSVVPAFNTCAIILEKLARSSNDQATGNYSVLAQK